MSKFERFLYQKPSDEGGTVMADNKLNPKDYPEAELKMIAIAVNEVLPKSPKEIKTDWLIFTYWDKFQKLGEEKIAIKLHLRTARVGEAIDRIFEQEDLRKTLRKVKKRLTEEKNKGSANDNPEEVKDEDIVRHINERLTYREIAGIYNLTLNQVKYRFERLRISQPELKGRKKRKPTRLAEEILNEVEQLRKDTHLSNDQILALLNRKRHISRSTLDRAILILIERGKIIKRPKLPGYLNPGYAKEEKESA